MTAVITVAFYACTDDKKDGISLVVNNGVTEVSIDRIGGEITVPVTTTGSWEATLADNSSKWATVWTGQGKGDGGEEKDRHGANGVGLRHHPGE